MREIVYTNISPISLAYPNINHFFKIKEELNPKKLYICVWDTYVLEDGRLQIPDPNTSKKNILEENILFLEKILKYLKINYEIIYFSEAWKRLMGSEENSEIFRHIISQIKISELIEYSSGKNNIFHDMTFSKINYILTDYLIATKLNEIYPEIVSENPTEYYSIYLKPFEKTILNSMEQKGVTKFMKNTIPKEIPLILHKQNGTIPSIGMSKEKINSIIRSHFNEKIDKEEIIEFLILLNKLIPENEFTYLGKTITLEKLINKILKSKLEKEVIIDLIKENLENYFKEIKKIISEIKLEKKKENIHIKNSKEFNNYLKSLNEIKITILKNCTGKNTSLDISKKTSIKLSTVSTYLSQLKTLGLITEGKKPERKFENIILNIGSI